MICQGIKGRSFLQNSSLKRWHFNLRLGKRQRSPHKRQPGAFSKRGQQGKRLCHSRERGVSKAPAESRWHSVWLTSNTWPWDEVTKDQPAPPCRGLSATERCLDFMLHTTISFREVMCVYSICIVYCTYRKVRKAFTYTFIIISHASGKQMHGNKETLASTPGAPAWPLGLKSPSPTPTPTRNCCFDFFGKNVPAFLYNVPM